MFRLLPEEEREDIFDIVSPVLLQTSSCLISSSLIRLEIPIYWTYFDESDEESGPAEGREARDGTA